METKNQSGRYFDTNAIIQEGICLLGSFGNSRMVSTAMAQAGMKVGGVT